MTFGELQGKVVVAEVNEASVNGVLDALEVSNDNGIINLPAAYFAMDDSAKAVFAQNIMPDITVVER